VGANEGWRQNGGVHENRGSGKKDGKKIDNTHLLETCETIFKYDEKGRKMARL
jgi:hypothetical protein